MSENVEIDFDTLYLNEFERNFKEYMEKLRGFLEMNNNTNNRYLIPDVHEFLKDLKLSLNGIKNENGFSTDKYSDELISDFIFNEKKRKVKPISIYMKTEYIKLRENAEQKYSNSIRPEIFQKNETDTIKYIAQYNAINTVFNRIIYVRWDDGESIDILFKRIIEKDFIPDPGFELAKSYYRNEFLTPMEGAYYENIRKERKDPAISPTSHAVAYYILSEAKQTGFSNGEVYYQEYCADKTFFDVDSFISIMKRIGKKLKNKSISLEMLEAAKKIIENFNNKVATNRINEIILIHKK
jgi:hypothetical protein